ncbi:ABC transporter substrate-binding protein [Acidobacteriota bacterium]
MTKDEKGRIVPDLAEILEQPDPVTYRFRLRQGVRFHDGKPLTASDVAFTFNTIRKGDLITPKKETFKIIQSIETPDDLTVVFRLSEPNAPFLSNLTTGIVQDGSKKGADFRPVGTGPFKFTERIPGSEIRFEANRFYFHGPPGIATLKYRIVPDATVRCLELKKGSADLAINNIPLDLLGNLESESHLKIAKAPGTNYQYLCFNLQDPILKHRKVRWAISHAIDREAMIRYLLHGLAIPAKGILPPMNPFYEGDVAEYSFDPDRAMALLDEAGYPDPDDNGPRARFQLLYKTTYDDAALARAQVIKDQLRRIGVDIRIRSYEWGTFYADIVRGKFQLFSLQWVGVSDPDIYDYAFHSERTPLWNDVKKRYEIRGANRGRYRNPELDNLLKLSALTVDLAARQAVCSSIQRIVAQDAPYVSLWHPNNVAVMRQEVQGLKLYPAGDFRTLRFCTKN